MHRAIQELIDAGAADHALKAGDIAPSFTLNDANGQPVSSVELLKHGPLVVTFYRGVWCPYCSLDLEALEAAQSEITNAGATLVAISPQLPVNSRKSIRQNGVTFPMLSDPGNDVAAAFGLRYTLPDYLIDLYKNAFNTDLELVNGDPSWTLPMPARYVIGQDGVILYAEVSPDYTNRPDPSELLPVLTALVF
jgi:peroxiredoxin